MKKIFLFAMAVMTLFNGQNVFAQEDGNRDANGKIIRGPYETNKFWDNWFIEAGVGAGMYLGGHNRNFSERITPEFNIGFGKWITPSVGVRASFDYQAKAKEYYYEIDGQFNYWNLHADFMWNLSNAIGGYKETRVYQVIPYVGAGYAQVVGANYFEGVGHAFALSAGIINKFRISNRVDLNLELRSSGATHMIDRINSSRTIVDVPVAITAGATIKLGKTNFQRVKPTETITVTDESLQKEYDKFKKDLDAANAENKALKEALAGMGAKEIIYKDRHTTCVSLFFVIGQSTLTEHQLANLEVYMDAVSECVKGEKKFNIIGAADKATGNKDINYRLSKERADYVKNILINKYNIKESNISVKYAGDLENHFDKPALNRTATLYITEE